MRLSEFAEKRIINVFDGEILGLAGDCDLVIDPDTGRILEITVPPSRGLSGTGKRQLNIPWAAVKKVGAEVIVVDIDDGAGVFYR